MGVTQIGTTWETKKKALWLLITDLVCARLVSLETMLLVPSSHLSLVAQDTWESWSVWDKRIPVMIDLVIMMEILTRINWKTEEMKKFEKLHPIMSLLSFMLKAPLVPTGTPVINSLFKQRAAMENIFRACIGLAPEHNMLLSQKTRGK